MDPSELGSQLGSFSCGRKCENEEEHHEAKKSAVVSQDPLDPDSDLKCQRCDFALGAEEAARAEAEAEAATEAAVEEGSVEAVEKALAKMGDGKTCKFLLRI